MANAPRFLPGVTLLSGVILIGFGCALEVETAQVREDVSARPDERTVTYELETTTIEVPLDSGGKPDFLAALERRASEGVTLENNAARDLFRVFGGGEHISPEERAAISTRLGLPEDTKPAIPGGFSELMKRPVVGEADEVEWAEEWEAGLRRPWTRAEFPELAERLDRIDGAIDELVRASRKPRYYMPRSSTEGAGLIGVTYEAQVLDAMYLLLMRAMLRRGEGECEIAAESTFAVIRWGRLLGAAAQALPQCAIAASVELTGALALAEILHACEPRSASLRARLRELESFDERATVATVLDSSERFLLIDAVYFVVKTGELHRLMAPVNDDTTPPALALLLRSTPPEPAIEIVNRCVDRLVEILRMPSASESEAAQRELLEEMSSSLLAARSVSGFFLSTLDPRERSRALAFELVSGVGLPGGVHDSVLREQDALKHAVLALALHRAEHGEYPRMIADLAGADPLLLDPGVFTYARVDHGYELVWRGFDGELSDPEDDLRAEFDVVLRVPFSEEKLPGEEG